MFDLNVLINWIVQAFISFAFGGLGAFVAFRFSIALEIRREERQQRRKIRTTLYSGDLPPGSIKDVRMRIRGERTTEVRELFTKSLVDNHQTLAYLIFLNANVEIGERKKYPIFGTTSVGKDPTLSELVFDDPTISDLHCTISVDKNNFNIIDHHSQYGTYVNDTRIEPDVAVVIDDGDVVQLGIGRYKFLFLPLVKVDALSDTDSDSLNSW